MKTKFKIYLAVVTLAGAVSGGPPRAAAAPPETAPIVPAIYLNHAGLTRLGWQFVSPTATFGSRKIDETIDLLHANVVHHIELSADQAPTPPTGGIDPDAQQRDAAALALLTKLHSVHMDIVSFDGPAFTKDPARARAVFALAQKLKVKYIVTRPLPGAVPMLDALATEYNVNVAIENSPYGPYQTPSDVLNVLKGRSARIGCCADVGGFRKTGLDPEASLRLLEPRTFEVRLEDGDDPAAHEGGLLVLRLLKASGFRGAIAIGGEEPLTYSAWADAVNRFSDLVTLLAPPAATPEAGAQP